MRKKIATLLIGVLSITLVGCGKGATDGTEYVEPVFTVMDEVKNTTPTSGVVQLDDIVLNVNLTTKIEDAVKAFEAGVDKDLYLFSEYNEKMLVSSGSTGSFTVYKNGGEYAYLYYWNTSKETVELADCYLSSVAIKPDVCSTFWIGGGLNLSSSNFTWDNIEGYMNDCGFSSGDADYSDSMQEFYPQSVYEDTSGGDDFKYLVSITYDKTHDVTNNNSTKSILYQYCTYTLKFDKDTHECKGITFGGVTTKSVNKLSVTVDKNQASSEVADEEETTEKETEMVENTGGTESIEENTEL